MLGESVADATVIDLFAGAGGLGLEALSRGARKCWFCDVSARSIALLRRNLEVCGVGAEGVALQADFRRALRGIAASLGECSGGIAASLGECAGGGVDLVLVDPPYDAGYYDEVMQTLLIHDMMSPGGLVVLESSAGARETERAFPGFCGIKLKRYGHTAVAVYERMTDEDQKNALRGNV
jgi:16S rRNA G966 N2-methylase RsmD